MSDIFARILSDGCGSQALLLASTLDEDELRTAAEGLDPQSLERIRHDVFQKLSTVNTRAMLWSGGLLTIYQAALAADRIKGRLVDKFSELGVSKTRGYASMAVFRSFGKPLMADDKLAARFTAEALKLLSAKHVPERVRDAAVEVAHSGEHITTARAKELLKEYGCDAVEDATSKASKSRATTAALKTLWSYVGSAVRLKVEAGDPATVPGVCVLQDLESAIAVYRDKFLGDDSSKDAA